MYTSNTIWPVCIKYSWHMVLYLRNKLYHENLTLTYETWKRGHGHMIPARQICTPNYITIIPYTKYSWPNAYSLRKTDQNITRCSARGSFIRPQSSNPERLGQVWTQHSSWIQLWIWIVIKKLKQHRFLTQNECGLMNLFFLLLLSNLLCCWILILSKKKYF